MIESKYLLMASLALVFALLLWWGFDWLRFYRQVHIGKKLAAEAEKFEKLNIQADYNILVLGDSTAVGTGVTDTKLSIAGRLVADYPNVSLKNLGVNGALVSDVITQLESVEGEVFDLVIIQAGGNDVVYFSDLKKFETDLAIMLQKVTKNSDRVIMLSSGDIGSTPIWPAGIGFVFTKRTQLVRHILLNKTAEHSVAFVDLYGNGVNAAFQDDPKLYHAIDSFHPSDEGYYLWYESLKMNLKTRGWL